MNINKIYQFLKLSFSFLILICGVEQALSGEVMDVEPAGQQGHKRAYSPSQEVEINDIVTTYPVISEHVSEYVQMHDLCSMELVCTTFAGSVRDARQYRAIVADTDNKGGWKLEETMLAKDLFLSLLQSSKYNFLVHFSDLWRNWFPLKTLGRFSDMPLPYYWGKHLTRRQAGTIHRFYQTCPFLWADPLTSKSPFFYKSLVGKIITADSTDRNFALYRQTCMDIINQTDENCLASTKAAAQLQLADMDILGRGGPVNVDGACVGYDAVLKNNAACPVDRANAQLRLAEMDYLGQGGPVNFDAARVGYDAVLNSIWACPVDRANAQLRLAEMDRLGQGGPVNYDAARAGYNAVCNNNAAPPRDRAIAQLQLAGMDYLGQGGPVNYGAARVDFNAVLNNNAASPVDRAGAQLCLAEMDHFGRGGPVNYAAARVGFNGVFNNNTASFAARATAQFRLAEMECLGQGGPVNYAAARVGYGAVLNSIWVSPADRAIARLRLAEMDRLEKADSKPTDSLNRSTKG